MSGGVPGFLAAAAAAGSFASGVGEAPNLGRISGFRKGWERRRWLLKLMLRVVAYSFSHRACDTRFEVERMILPWPGEANGVHRGRRCTLFQLVRESPAVLR